MVFCFESTCTSSPHDALASARYGRATLSSCSLNAAVATSFCIPALGCTYIYTHLVAHCISQHAMSLDESSLEVREAGRTLPDLFATPSSLAIVRCLTLTTSVFETIELSIYDSMQTRLLMATKSIVDQVCVPKSQSARWLSGPVCEPKPCVTGDQLDRFIDRLPLWSRRAD